MLLYLMPEAPVPPLSGGRERALQLLGALAERMPVHLLACAGADEAAPLVALARGLGLAGLTLQPYPASGRGYTALTPVARRLASELPALAAVHCQGLDLWPVARTLAAPRRVLELPDLPPELQPAPSEVTPDRRHAARLQDLNAAGTIVVVSDFDRQRLRAWGVRPPILVIANGVDLDDWAALPPAPANSPPTLLFSAALNWPPNVAAACVLVEEVLPQVQTAVPNVHVVVAGRLPTPDLRAWAARHPAVTLIADPLDMRPPMAAATLVVVPLAAASGPRLKILQALAAGRAVVSTPAGALGLDLVAGRDLVVAPLVAEFAAAVVRLLTDATERAALVAAGRAAVERYAWPAVLAAVDGLYEDQRL